MKLKWTDLYFSNVTPVNQDSGMKYVIYGWNVLRILIYKSILQTCISYAVQCLDYETVLQAV